MIMKIGFGGAFPGVPVHIDSTSTLHVAGNRTYSGRAKYAALRYFFIRILIKERRITLHYVDTANNDADIGTKHLGKQRRQDF